MRRCFVVLLGSCILMTSGALNADEPTAVVVTMGGGDRLRVQVSEGLTMPCDSSNNRMLDEFAKRPCLPADCHRCGTVFALEELRRPRAERRPFIHAAG